MYKNPWLARNKVEVPEVPDFTLDIPPIIDITVDIPAEIKLELPPIMFVCMEYPVTITDGVQTSCPPIAVDWHMNTIEELKLQVLANNPQILGVPCDELK